MSLGKCPKNFNECMCFLKQIEEYYVETELIFKFLLVSLAGKSSSKFDGCYFRKRGKTVLKISQTIKHPDRRNSSRNDNMAIKRKLFPQVSSPFVDSGGLGCRVSICKSLICHDRFLELKNYFKIWKILFVLPAPHVSCQPRG